MMRVLVLGGSGLLGHKLLNVFSGNAEVYATFRGEPSACIPVKRIVRDLNVTNEVRLVEVLRTILPDVVINAVGIVKQKRVCATDFMEINSRFPRRLAILCHNLNIRLIHFSTDCVFSGKCGNYGEYATPDPEDVYGITKLMGEVSHPGSLTLRTSIIGWQQNGRESLLSWFALQRGKTISGYRNAIYSGLSSTVLAEVVRMLVNDFPSLSGLYHVASKPISKYELLLCLRERLGWFDIDIQPEENFHCNRSLNGVRFNGATGWSPPEWDAMLIGLAGEWPQYERFYNNRKEAS